MNRCSALVVGIATMVVTGAAAAPAPPQVTVTGGSGAAGDMVGVTIALSGDDASRGVSLDADVRFPVAALEFVPPVSANCHVADRLSTTHQIAGSVREPGLLSLALLVRNFQVTPLGNGPLVTCEFHILPGATSQSAPLTLDFLGLGDSNGAYLDAVGVPGAIVIAAPARCAGDCNGDGKVTIDEILRGVRIALAEDAASVCAAADGDGDGQTSIAEVIQAVNASLLGCPSG